MIDTLITRKLWVGRSGLSEALAPPLQPHPLSCDTLLSKKLGICAVIMGTELQTKYQRLAQEYAKVWSNCENAIDCWERGFKAYLILINTHP